MLDVSWAKVDFLQSAGIVACLRKGNNMVEAVKYLIAYLYHYQTDISE